MINRSPSMALCLKFFSNQLTNARTLVLKRKDVTSPVRQPCTFLQEFLGTKNGVPPASHPVIPWSWEGQAQSSSTEYPNVDSTNRKRFCLSGDQELRVNVHSSRYQRIICQPNRRNRKNLDRIDTGVDSSLCVGVRPCVGTADDIFLKESCCTAISHPVVWNNVVYGDIDKQMLLLTEKSGKKPLFRVKEEYISGDPSQPPNEDQLERVRNILAEDLSMLFVSSFDYRIYHPDIIFENNIQGLRTEGIVPYVKKVCWLRTVGHIKFMYVKFEVMKITAHPEDGCVRVRWRIRGIRAMKIFQFWKFKLWDFDTVWEQLETWFEGFSTFYVLGDGLIHKHVADKMIPDQQEPEIKERKKKMESVPAAPSPLCVRHHRMPYTNSQNIAEVVFTNELETNHSEIQY